MCATQSISKIWVHSVPCVLPGLAEAPFIIQESKRGRPQHTSVFHSKFLGKSQMLATCGVPTRTHTSMKNLVSVPQSKESKQHQVLLGPGKRKLSVFPARIGKCFQLKKKCFPISQVSEGTPSLTSIVILQHYLYNIWIRLHFFFSNIGGYCLIKLVSGRI